MANVKPRKTKPKRVKKIAKKEVKSVFPSDFVRKKVIKACAMTLEEIRLLNSTKFDCLKSLNLDRLDYHIKREVIGQMKSTKNIITTAKLALSNELNTTPRTWQFWVGIFSDNVMVVDVSISAGTIEDAIATEATDSMATIVQDTIDNAEGLNPDNITDWAWVLAPTTDVDLVGASDSFINTFIEHHGVGLTSKV